MTKCHVFNESLKVALNIVKRTLFNKKLIGTAGYPLKSSTHDLCTLGYINTGPMPRRSAKNQK